ncbi:MAG: EamA family transporter [Anaerolineae bacterium]
MGATLYVVHDTKPARGRFTNLIILLILGFLWGSSYLFIKIAVGEVPTLTLVAGRLLVATVLMWGLLLITRQSLPRSRALWGSYAVVGLLSGVVPYSLVAWSEQFIPSSLASLLQATLPLFTVVLAHFMIADERLQSRRILGVLVGFVGVALLMLPALQSGVRGSILGQLAMVASSISYALSTIYARNRLRDQPPLVTATGQFTMGLLFILPLVLILETPFHLSLSWAVVGSWLGLTVFGTILAYILYYALIARASATFVSTVTYIIPVNGLLLGALVLDEPLSLMLFLSLGLILLGVLLVRK